MQENEYFIRVELIVNEEDGIDEDEIDHTCDINFYVKDLKIASMHVSEPNLFSPDEYREAADPEKPFAIEYCDSNGGVQIWYKQRNDKDGKCVTFYTGRYGAGGGGDIHITIPHEYCKHIFLEMAEKLA